MCPRLNIAWKLYQVSLTREHRKNCPALPSMCPRLNIAWKPP